MNWPALQTVLAVSSTSARSVAACFVAIAFAVPLARAQSHARAIDLPGAQGQELVAFGNRGQWSDAVRFAARRDAATLWCERGGFLLAVERRSPENLVPPSLEPAGCGGPSAFAPRQGVAVRIAFAGAASTAEPRGESVLPGAFAFYLGDDPSRWRERVPAWSTVCYREVLPGISVVLRGEGASVAYDLHVAAHAAPEELELTCEGIESLRLGADGSLILETELGSIVQRAPVSWQIAPDGRRIPIASAFALTGQRSYRLAVTNRDSALPLVVDPGFDWSTLLGGSGDDTLLGLSADASGVTVSGTTSSFNYPGAPGPFNGGNYDAVATRLDPSQVGVSQLVWATYVGGAGNESFLDQGAGAGDTLALVGLTTSTNFPTTQGSPFLGGMDGVFTILQGGALVYSVVLGSPGDERICGIVETRPNEYALAGFTNSSLFPVTPAAYDTLHGGNYDLFVASFDIGRSTPASPFLWCTYLGGSGEEGYFRLNASLIDFDLLDLDVQSNGLVTVASRSDSPDYPTTSNAVQPIFGGGLNGDIVVSRLDATGSNLVYSTYFGASGDDFVNRAWVHESGDIYLAGGTWSSAFLTTQGAYDRFHGGMNDGALVVIRPAPSPMGPAGLVYSTFIGGTGRDFLSGIAVDRAGIASIAGQSAGGLSPTTGALQMNFVGSSMGCLLRLDAANAGSSDMHYLSYFGNGNSGLFGLVQMDDGRVVVVGDTLASSFPLSPGAFQTMLRGIADAVVARLDLLPRNALSFGVGTAACDPMPDMQVNRDPASPAQNFTLICNDAPASSLGILALGVPALVPTPLLNAGLWLPWPLLVHWPVQAQPGGYARSSLPIPGGLSNLVVGLQYLWLAPPTCPAALAASAGLQVTL